MRIYQVIVQTVSSGDEKLDNPYSTLELAMKRQEKLQTEYGGEYQVFVDPVEVVDEDYEC